MWKDVNVGQIVRINEKFPYSPCDLLLINSSDKEGYCYVETKQLDGETNLKLKKTDPDLNTYFSEPGNLAKLNEGKIKCDAPCDQLYKCGVDFESSKLGKKVLNIDNVILRGMILKNTKSIIGISIYTGHDTRIQRNFSKAKYKVSRLMASTNSKILIIFGI